MDATTRQAEIPPLQVEIAPDVRDLRLGIVDARQMSIGPSPPACVDWCRAQGEIVRRDGSAGGDARREAVRKLLREGGFKPAGRNKPAQEYLLRTVQTDGTLPTILNVVDALNGISLTSGLPISLLSMHRLGSRAIVRYGRAGERFVFNRAGQELDLEGLICVCTDRDLPLGTPIKDSMSGKVTEDDRDVAAVLYAPSFAVSAEELDHWTHELAAAFRRLCPATMVREARVESSQGT